METSILDPSKLTLLVLGCKVEGFTTGTFDTIERDVKTFTTRQSLKGKTLVNRAKYSTYRFTFRLDSTSSANTWLHSIYKIQAAYGVIFPVPVIYKDNNGDTSFFAPTCIIEEPRTEQGNVVSSTEWVLTCPNAMNTVGGNVKSQALAQTLKTITQLISISSILDLDLSEMQSQAQDILSRGREFIGGFL